MENCCTVTNLYSLPTNQDLAGQSSPTDLLTRNNFRLARDPTGTFNCQRSRRQTQATRNNLRTCYPELPFRLSGKEEASSVPTPQRLPAGRFPLSAGLLYGG